MFGQPLCLAPSSRPARRGGVFPPDVLRVPSGGNPTFPASAVDPLYLTP
jgi:hypothetical protein